MEEQPLEIRQADRGECAALSGSWDGPTLPLKIIDRDPGIPPAVVPVPAKTLLEYEGARVLIVQVPPGAEGETAFAALQDGLADTFGALEQHTVMIAVERLDDVREMEFRVPLPSADDAEAVEWFAQRLFEARLGANGTFRQFAAVFLRALAEWPGGAA